MIRIARWRPLTFVLVIGLGLFTILRASTLLRYGLAETRADGQTTPENLAPFVADLSVGPLARANLLASLQTDDPRERYDALREIVKMTPLASDAWLELAKAGFESRAPNEKIVNALAMSHLTGPNEGPLMAARAVFGLPLWSMAPPDVRRMLIQDLIGGWAEVKNFERQALRAMFSVAHRETRESVRAGLSSAGRQSAPITENLGLTPHPPAKR